MEKPNVVLVVGHHWIILKGLNENSLRRQWSGKMFVIPKLGQPYRLLQLITQCQGARSSSQPNCWRWTGDDFFVTCIRKTLFFWMVVLRSSILFLVPGPKSNKVNLHEERAFSFEVGVFIVKGEKEFAGIDPSLTQLEGKFWAAITLSNDPWGRLDVSFGRSVHP